MIIDVGYGYILKPDRFSNEEERMNHHIKRQIKERRLCAMYGINYDEVLQRRGEKCLLKGVGVIV